MNELTHNDIGKIMSFQVYPSAILGSSFDNVELLSINNYRTIQDQSPAILHSQVYPTVPDTVGMPNNFKNYLYGTFRLQNGKVVIVGLPWIKTSTIRYSTNRVIKITIRGLSGSNDLVRLKNLLLANNITDFDLEAEE